jgi:hypothetical protein
VLAGYVGADEYTDLASEVMDRRSNECHDHFQEMLLVPWVLEQSWDYETQWQSHYLHYY